MTVAVELDLDALILKHGAHESPDEGMCVMEAVAYMAGEPFSDHPKCASPIISSFLRSLNDRLSDEDRQILKPYIPKLIGTNTGAADEETRRWMCADWLVHEYAPAIFRTAGMTAEAEMFEQLVAITSIDEWRAARETIYRVRDAAREKRRAAVADADADAVAAAVADAAAAAAAAAAADADAVAVAAAAAAAAAVADADGTPSVYKQAAVAVAAVKSKGGSYWDQWGAAYKLFRPHYDKLFAGVAPGLRVSALGLVDRMIEVGKRAA